jgi:hypothetical protein
MAQQEARVGQAGTGIAKAGSAALVGTFHGAEAINTRLGAADRDCHLVSPATSAGTLPAGCGITISLVHVDAKTETYEIPGGSGRGLSKVALDKISAASGISWNPHLSGRRDDGRDPNYVHYVSVGQYKAFDGQVQVIMAEKIMDVRDGSPTVLALHAKAAERRPLGDATKQIRELRLHILGHAETKARLRAIRSLGIRTSYSPAELERPFAVARIMFTGQTNDPELKRLFAEKTADAFLSGTNGLYGGPPPRLAAPVQTYALPAPPVSASRVDPDDVTDEPVRATDSRVVETTGTSAPAQRDAKLANGGANPRLSLPTKKGEPDRPIGDSSDKDLAYWQERIAKALDNGSARNPDLDGQRLAAIEHEMKRRLAAEAKPTPAEGDVKTSPMAADPADERSPFDGDDFPT